MSRLSLTAKAKLGLLGAALVVGIALPYLISPFLVGIVTLALVLGLFAMSIDLLAGYGGLVTLGQAGIMASAGYGVGYVATRAGGGHATQVVVGLAAGLAVSVIFALPAMRTTGIYFIMVTAAEGMIVWGLALRLSDVTGAENGLRGIVRPPMIAAYWKYYYFCLAIVSICGGLLWVIVKSPLGLSLQGLRESESRMRMLGYNTVLLKFLAFVVSGFFATVAGILLVYRDQFISPAVTEFLASANGVLMAILGGIGTLVGPLIGAFVIVMAENVLSTSIERWPTVLGLVFMATILFARDGFVGAVSRGWGALLRRRGWEPSPAAPAAPTSTPPDADSAYAVKQPSTSGDDGADTRSVSPRAGE
jgi:branched-chain amino acid transport system permease protein